MCLFGIESKVSCSLCDRDVTLITWICLYLRCLKTRHHCILKSYFSPTLFCLRHSRVTCVYALITKYCTPSRPYPYVAHTPYISSIAGCCFCYTCTCKPQVHPFLNLLLGRRSPSIASAQQLAPVHQTLNIVLSLNPRNGAAWALGQGTDVRSCCVGWHPGGPSRDQFGFTSSAVWDITGI